MNEPIKYYFGGRLTAGFPSQVIIDVTEVCILACIHCPHPTFKLSEHYEARYLDTELNKKLVDEVRDYGPGGAHYIRYTRRGRAAHPPEGLRDDRVRREELRCVRHHHHQTATIMVMRVHAPAAGGGCAHDRHRQHRRLCRRHLRQGARQRRPQGDARQRAAPDPGGIARPGAAPRWW